MYVQAYDPPSYRFLIQFHSGWRTCLNVTLCKIIILHFHLGRESQAVFLSTTEPTHVDGSSRNPTRSLCEPYVFNTAITRARSLIVSTGNPFLLLKMEEQMIHQYGSRGYCWSTYLKLCLEHNTLRFYEGISPEQQEECKKHLHSHCQSSNDPSTVIESLQKKLKELNTQSQLLSETTQLSERSPSIQVIGMHAYFYCGDYVVFSYLRIK